MLLTIRSLSYAKFLPHDSLTPLSGVSFQQIWKNINTTVGYTAVLGV